MYLIIFRGNVTITSTNTQKEERRKKTGEKYIQPAGINGTHLDKLQFIDAHKMHFVLPKTESNAFYLDFRCCLLLLLFSLFMCCFPDGLTNWMAVYS